MKTHNIQHNYSLVTRGQIQATFRAHVQGINNGEVAPMVAFIGKQVAVHNIECVDDTILMPTHKEYTYEAKSKKHFSES